MNTSQMLEAFPDVDLDVVRRMDEIINDPDDSTCRITRGLLYIRMRDRGEPQRFAAMCAMQRPPLGMTDDVFWGGRKHFSEVYGETYANEIKQILARQGVHMTCHDEYCPELADYRGDPKGVINRAGGTSHIRKVCEAKGVSCDAGTVKVKPRPVESDPLAPENCIPMGEDLIRDRMPGFRATQPGASKLSDSDLREAIIEKHGPQ